MIGTVYIHTNKANGKCYVGQTWNLSERWKPSAYRGCDAFVPAIRKYGWGGFDHQIVVQQEMTQEELDNYEKLWIAVLNTTDRNCGYNLRTGGSRGLHTAESIEKVRRSSTGRKYPPRSEEAKRNMSLAHKGQFPAQLFTPEAIEKRAASQRGKKLSKERCAQISASGKGRKAPNKGIPMPEESKRKVSNSLRAYFEEQKLLFPDKQYAGRFLPGHRQEPRSPAQCLQISERKKKWWADRKAAQSSEIQ